MKIDLQELLLASKRIREEEARKARAKRIKNRKPLLNRFGTPKIVSI